MLTHCSRNGSLKKRRHAGPITGQSCVHVDAALALGDNLSIVSEGCVSPVFRGFMPRPH